MKHYIYSFFQKISYFFYPSSCRNCFVFIGRDEIFCKPCSSLVEPVASLSLKVNSAYSLIVFSASKYKDPVKSLIHKKFSGDISAMNDLGKLICSQINLENLSIDFIVPIPLHWTRYAKRGFNQSQIISKEISKFLNVPIMPMLKRSKKTAFQSSLKDEHKEVNVRDAFCISSRFRNGYKDLLKNKTILIVDDLMTSGATINSAARLFLDAKPKSLFCVVAARAC